MSTKKTYVGHFEGCVMGIDFFKVVQAESLEEAERKFKDDSYGDEEPETIVSSYDIDWEYDTFSDAEEATEEHLAIIAKDHVREAAPELIERLERSQRLLSVFHFLADGEMKTAKDDADKDSWKLLRDEVLKEFTQNAVVLSSARGQP